MKTERQVTHSQRCTKEEVVREETAKVDKVLCKFKTNSITKTNELFYAGAVAVKICWE